MSTVSAGRAIVANFGGHAARAGFRGLGEMLPIVQRSADGLRSPLQATSPACADGSGNHGHLPTRNQARLTLSERFLPPGGRG
jgi:hypothetical protein